MNPTVTQNARLPVQPRQQQRPGMQLPGGAVSQPRNQTQPVQPRAPQQAQQARPAPPRQPMARPPAQRLQAPQMRSAPAPAPVPKQAPQPRQPMMTPGAQAIQRFRQAKASAPGGKQYGQPVQGPQDM